MTRVSRWTTHWPIPLLLTLFALPAFASDLYRVELLLFERTGTHPEMERLNHQTPPELPDNGIPLWVDADWEPETDEALPESEAEVIAEAPNIIALPTDNIRLSNIARQLRQEGNYNVLAFTAWEEAFPQGHRTTPLIVDLRPGTDKRTAVRGWLTIERRRYLHVRSDLYHLGINEEAALRETIDGMNLLERLTGNARDEADRSLILHRALRPESPAAEPEWEVLTWLRELRRMRSGEIHYLDSPSLGLVVYFHRIERDEETEENDADEATPGD